ncbi:hypothetical protein CN425_00590 [Bacillus cereus]|uniref:Uncharacterized protein n=1 Tax=Bacillus cereus TaxID=1396 RepID=A0A2A9UR99_BACCE|nr:hypothetical protein CON38_02040 [Bacillus cereus]PEW07145.1 hypothetical protein CN425_00590 [Bacillus cereus]PEX89892.1 hypothetical protein CN450_13125 [Bacillus cereus]PFI24462.1 hypothetical protein COI75_08990 [Bacillus cereus]PFN23809.1 hypothetical protein COJ50_16370 [Bacillus cereus]
MDGTRSNKDIKSSLFEESFFTDILRLVDKLIFGNGKMYVK